MNDLSPLEIEGRMNGQRKVLAVILSEMIKHPGVAQKIEALAEISDHQEDPGAVPDQAFVTEASAAREVRLLLESARALSHRDETDG